MPAGETEKEPSGWTVDTLSAFMQRQLDDMRSLLDERYATQVKALDAAFAAAERAVQAALLAAEKAVAKAETAAEKRFESVNEFRGQLADQQATFLPRSEADVRIQAIAEKVDSLNTSRDRGLGVAQLWGYLVGAAAVAVAIFVAVKGNP